MIICFEGLDGTGKSSLSEGFKNYLSDNNYNSILIKWNSNEYINDLFQFINENNMYDVNLNVSLLIGELLGKIDDIVELSRERIVIFDRYLYTLLSRDVIRGANEKYIKKIQEMLPEPDIIIWCDSPNNTLISRLEDKNSGKINFWETGLEIGYETNIRNRISDYDNDRISKDVIYQNTESFMNKVRERYIDTFKETDARIININTSRQNFDESMNKIIREVSRIDDFNNNTYKL